MNKFQFYQNKEILDNNIVKIILFTNHTLNYSKITQSRQP